MKQFKPYIPADKVMPELTPIPAILGIILAVVFGGANAYLGLRVGMTRLRFHPCCRSFYGYCAHDHAPRFYSGK